MKKQDRQTDYEAARIRLTIALAEKNEIKNAILKKEYMKKSDVNKEYGRMVSNIKSRLLAMPSTLAMKLWNKQPAEIEETLTEAIYEVLKEFAEGKLI